MNYYWVWEKIFLTFALTVHVYKSLHIHWIWLQIAKHSAIFNSIVIKINLAFKLLPCGQSSKDGGKVYSCIVWTDWLVYILLKEITYQIKYLNKFIWLQNCSFINLLCSSLLTDEYQLHKTIRFIPKMTFRQSTQLILKL